MNLVPAWKPDFVRLDLKPDRLNNTPILRGIATVGGDRIQTETKVFPPAAQQSPPPVVTLDEQAERLKRRLIAVTDQAVDEGGAVTLTLFRFKSKFTRGLRAGLFRAGWIERERIKAHLRKHGLKSAALAIDALPLENS